MSRFFAALLSAWIISGVVVLTEPQAPAPQKPGTEVVVGTAQTAAKNLIEEVSAIGCIRLWRPATADPTRMPPDRQPGLAGIYLLTTISSNPNAATDLPTYLLTPSGTLNFSQHVGHKVEITGTAQAAPLPPTVQDIATPTPRPEEKPSTTGMPRLTVTTMKMVTESCP